mmetsp:Transcript_23703/g.28529  ORF Transcript_23703/g.28529 Transcript_23703/m.28529 type:complete len:103 (-) Transcript_23703:340-648(-)
MASRKKRKVSEEDAVLDEIFSALSKESKKKKHDPEKKKIQQKEKKIMSKEEEAEWKVGSRTKEPSVHRYTAEGLPVYKYYHLGMKQDDGGTPLCPFDCDCCF